MRTDSAWKRPVTAGKLIVLLNGVSQLEFDRDKVLPTRQQEYLDRMDAQMDGGITLEDGRIDSPDAMQRARFVAVNLVQAVRNAEASVAAAMCAYLAVRLPELRQVSATEEGETVLIDLVFDEKPANAVIVNFTPPSKGGDSTLH